ncbi:hypothetical protein Dacet_1089 [Denitrovibrio acetiphilus DSM 12809]|uniref:Helix-turn-helix domain-containing protein n=1 Tax=Denitrovibrio acetiphilus (strain DSM 12809 / NBRC 114555 / N2460) TaxID=522772 RepID=D4H6Z5_DENA2|nr:hypothetical protein [Denitrovibrio acetiphilus]ADD67861.1 hypothetical protein Dacet_1089 [Denitrovibrio acetiphilus DSM 12809]
MNNHTQEELLTYEELARELKMSVKTLQNWKSLGVFHPKEYVKFGDSKQADIRFKKSAIYARIKDGKFIK